MIDTRIAKFYSDYATVWTVRISFPNGGTELCPSIPSTPLLANLHILTPSGWRKFL